MHTHVTRNGICAVATETYSILVARFTVSGHRDGRLCSWSASLTSFIILLVELADGADGWDYLDNAPFFKDRHKSIKYSIFRLLEGEQYFEVGNRSWDLLEKVVFKAEDLAARVRHIVSSVRFVWNLPIQVTNDRLSSISSGVSEYFAINTKQSDVQVKTDARKGLQDPV